jgi:hypothetical protein
MLKKFSRRTGIQPPPPAPPVSQEEPEPVQEGVQEEVPVKDDAAPLASPTFGASAEFEPDQAEAPTTPVESSSQIPASGSPRGSVGEHQGADSTAGSPPGSIVEQFGVDSTAGEPADAGDGQPGTDSTAGQVVPIDDAQQAGQGEDELPQMPDEPPPLPPLGGDGQPPSSPPGAESQLASSSHTASSASTMPPLGAGVGTTEEDPYDMLQFEAIFPIHRELLDQMRLKDPKRKGEFSINQVRELWRHLQEIMAGVTKLDLTFQEDLKRRVLKRKLSTACCIAGGVVPLFFLLWAAMALVHATLRSFAVGYSGALVEPSFTTAPGDMWPIASADTVALHRLQEYPTMELAALFRLCDVVFMHNDVFHHFQVSSFIYKSEKDLFLTGADGATLHVVDGSVRFKRGIHQEEFVDLSETERYAAREGDDWPWTVGGRFSIQTEVS